MRNIGFTIAAALFAVLLAAPVAQAASARIDRGFASSGRLASIPELASSALGPNASFTALAPDGAVLAAAESGPPRSLGPSQPYFDVLLRRFGADGLPDRSFGAQGTVKVEPPPGHTFSLSAFAVDRLGRPLAIGSLRGASEALSPFGLIGVGFAAVFRYTADGRPDPAFGGGDGLAYFNFGLASGPSGHPEVSASDAVLDRLGRVTLVVAQGEMGESSPDSPRPRTIQADKLLARLTVRGELDKSFDGDGTVPLGPKTRVEDIAIAGEDQTLTLALSYPYSGGPVQSDGPAPATQLLRLDETGAPDQGFGPDGYRNYRDGIRPIDLAVDRWGRAMLLGETSPAPDEGFSTTQVMRVRANGVLDRSFGQSGVLSVRLPGSQLEGLLPDRKGVLLLGGISRDPDLALDEQRHDFLILRRTESGAPDRAFGARGRLTTSFGPSSDAMAREAALSGRGRLVVGGFAGLGDGPAPSQVMARYLLPAARR